jgi:8-oxo-dGTP diphosphatase
MGKEEQGLDPQRYLVIPRTLLLLFNDQDVLLLKGAAAKQRWAGKYNGLGGHVERGEDILSSAKRELEEESGLSGIDLHLCGTILCDVEEFLGVVIFVYKGYVDKVRGKASEEGALEWVPVSGIHALNVVEDLRVIIPRVFQWSSGEKPFSATNAYDEQGKLVTTFFE